MATSAVPAVVLLVEDSADIREAISFVLESEGYRVQTAVDGLDAVSQLEEGLRPSLIMLDLAMPRMDGFEFRTWQSHDDRFSDIPVVVYSGAFDIDEVSRSLGVPAFRKPIDIDRMLDLVATYAVRP